MKRGPWPGCLEMNGDDCADMITSYTSNSKHDQVTTIEIITPDMEDSLSKDFDPNRVRIHVNNDGIVWKIPIRGH